MWNLWEMLSESGSVQIDVIDSAGKISHTSVAPVGANGYFDYRFHVDMQPGHPG